MKKILIAGIGNIFHGDDGFGCEVLRQLDPRSLPAGVTARDFGIRSYDMAYAIVDGHDVVIMVDAASRGQPPGTVYLIEPDLNRLEALEQSAVDAHAMNPVAVLQLAKSLGGIKAAIYLVACEPAVLESEDGQMELSEPVRQAVPQALAMIDSLVKQIFDDKQTVNAAPVAA